MSKTRPPVKMPNNGVWDRLSTTAQDVAYAAAKGIDQSYGADMRHRMRSVGENVPVVKQIKGRKNRPLNDT